MIMRKRVDETNPARFFIHVLLCFKGNAGSARALSRTVGGRGELGRGRSEVEMSVAR